MRAALDIAPCAPADGMSTPSAQGGANTGSNDMASGIEKLNERIRELFVHEVRSGYINLPETDASKFLLVPRCSSGSSGESIEFDKFTMRLSRPQVLVMCMNASQVKSLIGNSTKRTAQVRAPCCLHATLPAVLTCTCVYVPRTMMSTAYGVHQAGAQSGLLDIMKGSTNHPYPPKCHDPYAPFDNGANRKLSRLYFILDEDGGCQAIELLPTSTVTTDAARPCGRPEPFQHLQRHREAAVRCAPRGQAPS